LNTRTSDKQIDLTIPPSLPAGADGPKSSTDRCSLTERARIELNSPTAKFYEICLTRRSVQSYVEISSPRRIIASSAVNNTFRNYRLRDSLRSEGAMKQVGWSSILVAVVLLAVAVMAKAQQPTKIPRIGYVSGTGDPTTPGSRVELFRQGLRELGYIEGKNILVEYRYAEGKLDRAPALVAELLQLKVDVLVVTFLPASRAAREATKTIPIVVVTSVDPVATGLVDSLAHPGGNITGLTTLTKDLSGKRLELFKEAIPVISRVGVLWDSNAEAPAISLKEYEAAARALNIPLQSLGVRGPNPDLDGAFQAAAKGRANALIMISSPVLSRYAKRIPDLAIKNRLPSSTREAGM
jgi:putative tryptophan/tyrosine transport system substrate-binding protein